MPVISIIVAIAANGAIGKDNKLLFHLPGDLKRFKQITTGHPVIMGRNTWLSLPRKPLPGRRNIVITDQPGEQFDGCVTVNNPEEAIELAKDEAEVFIIGGARIYHWFYPITDRLYLTLVHREYDADAYFPEILYTEWETTGSEDHFDVTNSFNYTYLNLERKRMKL